MVRESRDEEMVADLVAFMCFKDVQPTRWERFDEYFGVREGPRHTDIETAVARIGPDVLTAHFVRVFDELRATLALGNRPFAALVLGQDVARVPRYFQVVFLAMCKLLVTENFEVGDRTRLYQMLENCGNQMKISGGGGTWAAAEKEKNINAIQGLLKPCFRPKQGADPAFASWVTQLENLLTQSYTEQNLYDFKQGFCTLEAKPKFDIGCLSKTMITLSAMANLGPKARGYVVVGVADKVADVERLETIANVKHRVYNSFFVTGIAHEADALGKTLEQYLHYVVERVKHEPVSANLKQHILSSIRLVRYFDKSLIVFEAEGQREPSVYDNRYYMRYGSQNNELQGEHLAPLFARFFRHGH